MANTPFDPYAAVPTDSRGPAFTKLQKDLQVIRDMLVCTGSVQGFAYTHSGGTTEFPATITFTRGSEKVKVDIVYTTTVRGAYVPIKYSFYSWNGASWDPIIDEDNNYILYIYYQLKDDAAYAGQWDSV
jgi:hypothetical protein